MTEQPATPLFAVDPTTIAYGRKVVIDSLAFQIDKPQIIGMVGPNGVGKTTLLRFLAGSIPGTGDRLRVNDLSPKQKSLYNKSIFFLEDVSTLDDRFKGIDYLRYVQRLWRSKRPISEIIESFSMQRFIKKPISSYSQGMEQLLVLAMAFISDTAVLLLDEPMNCLDPTNRIVVQDLLRQYRQQGKCIILSTHQLAEIDGLADMVWFIKDAGIAYTRLPGDQLSSQQIYEDIYLKPVV